MKIYLAAPYWCMNLMLAWEQVLEARGHTCTSQWIHGAEENLKKTLAECAQMDLDDVDAADAVISLMLPQSERNAYMTGGRHVEFGYGIAREKLMIIVGAPENVFHYLPRVVACSTIEEALNYIGDVRQYG